jgi:hypothetical protein
MPTSTYTPLATVTIGSPAGSVTFSSIPATYRDLIVTFSGSLSASTRIDLRVGAGSLDTGNNYNSVIMWGNGTSASSVNYNNNPLMYTLFDPTNSGTGIVNASFSIMDYSATNKHKTFIGRADSSTNLAMAFAGRWASTSALTTIALLPIANFTTGSVVSLYGIAS